MKTDSGARDKMDPDDEPNSDRPLLAKGYITVTQLGISYEPLDIQTVDLSWIESAAIDPKAGQASPIAP